MSMCAKAPVPLTSTSTEAEAAIIVATLEEYGIRAKLVGDFIVWSRPALPGDSVQVMVAHEDLEAAQRVLANFTDAPAKIDWSKIDVGEPDEE